MTRGASSPRIFQIGFNRCGTTTLIRFFQANNLKCVPLKSNILDMNLMIKDSALFCRNSTRVEIMIECTTLYNQNP